MVGAGGFFLFFLPAPIPVAPNEYHTTPHHTSNHMRQVSQQDSLPMEVDESLSPVEAFIQKHCIAIIPSEVIVKRIGEIRIPWIAEYDGLIATGKSRNEAVLRIAKSFALDGWELISW